MSTKAASLSKLKSSGRAYTLDEAVLAQVKALGPVCRDALCTAAGILTQSACGTLNRLEKRGLIEKADVKVWNHTTRRWVAAYQLKETKP